MFELVLRLLCLLSSLLLLDHTERILCRWLLLGAALVEILAMRLGSDLVLRRLGLAVRCVDRLLHLLLLQILLSSDAE